MSSDPNARPSAVVLTLEDAKKYRDDYDGNSPGSHFYQARLSTLFELIGHAHGRRVLDCGCGPAVVASQFLRLQNLYVGIDLSESMLREAANQIGQTDQGHLVRARVEHLPFQSECFDLVTCLGVLEYVDDVLMALQEVSRVCANGAIVVASMLNRNSPYRYWHEQLVRHRLLRMGRALIERRVGGDAEPLNMLSVSRVVSVFSRCGLDVSEIAYYDYNIWLTPLDRWFPKVAATTAARLEWLRHTSLRKLGTAFLVKASKK